MDAPDSHPPPNSKVIIECIDPHNLFDRLEPRLSARSPLQNLHWKSPNRPLRSIANLNISLTRDDPSAGVQTNVRRHQIPGLRETPYVKLYLLRCDDKETYKEKVRKEVRQWVKTQTPSSDGKSSSKSQEDHDAFEWLIVHVVLPNTPAASQPKSSKHISLEASESTDSVNSKSKWSGKSPSTIFDKLRADFSSSKSSVSRVAQVRLLEPGDKATALTPAELEEQWQDLVDCLKTCILRSFDARVAQYELDIRERDSQRSLPGWNFCTFLVLKEGLAKGFENLGLLEDALAVYDELSLGLDTLVKEQARKNDHDESGALLAFSKESKNLLRAALDSESQSIPRIDAGSPLDLVHILTADREDFPFDVERKNYRNLILSNDVSALDLRIYLFTRELEILTRQSRLVLGKSSQPGKPSADLDVVADLTERALEFISLAGRTLRFELYNAWGGYEGLSEAELRTQRIVTSNIVSTWQWKAVMQILTQALPALGGGVDYSNSAFSLDTTELSPDPDAAIPDQSHGSSESYQPISLASGMRSSSRERSLERSKRHSPIPNGSILRHGPPARTGFARLVLWISKLVLMARHFIETLEAVKPWVLSMKQSALKSNSERMEPIAINGEANCDPVEDHLQPSPKTELLLGLGSSTLRAAATSKSSFVKLYAMLSVLAFRIVSPTKPRSTFQQILTDLIEVEYSEGNWSIAARYLGNVLGPLPRGSYRPSEEYLLRIYAECLKSLERPSEYARCLISCLHHSRNAGYATSRSRSDANQYYMNQLFQVLPNIPATTLRASLLFRISAVSRHISPHESKDGFTVSINISSLSGASTPPIDNVKLRLIARDGVEPRSILLFLPDKVNVDSRDKTITLETPVTTHGWYLPDEVEVCIGNLRLLHHFKSGIDDEDAGFDDSLSPRADVVPLLLYPSYRSFGIKMYPFPIIHLAHIRRLLLQVRPGQNNIKQVKLRLRTATAGLRLNIHDSKSVGSQHESNPMRTAREGDALVMIMDNLAPLTITDIEIPYTMEASSEPAIMLRIEAGYETDQGIFTFYDTAFVKVILPVTVNVQDVFRRDCMYSRFTIIPSTMVPLRLIGCNLEKNESHDMIAGGSFNEPFVVFPKQPANWTVRLVPKDGNAADANRRLTLVVDFQSLDGVMLAILETHFTRELANSKHAFATRLLTSHLLERVRTTWTEQDVEVAGLTQEFEVWKMEDMEWPSVLCAFDRKRRAEIEDWLRDWHSRTPPIKFSSSKVPQRQLRLFVDIPPRPTLVSAFLDAKWSKSPHATATIGQPLLAEIIIKLEDQVEGELEGSFEIAVPSDSWLIGGRRKGNVQLGSEAVRMHVVLFPQHLGHLLVPSVSVKCRRRVRSSGKDEWIDLMTDVQNPAHGRTILVTPDLRSTTVEVFGVTADEGAGKLVASFSRGGAPRSQTGAPAPSSPPLRGLELARP
ncbi:uncharacterized protein Z520_04709 [Fonsecaea multimorphosa CBS 102226]|uniref:Trafficking protein particle complex subunit 11 domain-containing protein n=1 Tax=Fonsecaea multimorphosa CBS 102226 TaxID=1442371 RepID=A0A0D2KQY9_9EURO|nr:uncharacterized protein Z520_04709 [Fonsecaea multimorphosa CBS 102226]KIX99133.1 hypothetical protein Z520_04709 [Fonsecaea multimorphosa CBS 102226]OAL26045.1 hypothetical protein AYO22_04459 [Fonsecaea multimorphosa]